MSKFRIRLSKFISEKFICKTDIYFIGVISLLILHFFCQIQVTEYQYDAWAYWDESGLYGLENFNLLNYNHSLRGYLFPLFLYFLRKLAYVGIGTEQLNWWIGNSLLLAAFFTLLVPQIIEIMFGVRVSGKSRVVFLIISMFMFRGMIVYPLTDLFGIMLSCLAIYFFLLLMKEKITKKLIQILCAICMGAALAGAYYIRPVYLIVWIALMCFSFGCIVKTKKRVLLYMILGMLFIAMPQIRINRAHFNTYSPMVQTQVDRGESLYLSQLKWGIIMQKYETNIDKSVKDVSAGMAFKDSIGEAILEKEEIDSYFTYIIFCIRHFADMTCIYLKHIFNGLDIIYPNIYIENLYSNRFITQFVNYMLMFIGGEGLAYYIKKKYWDGLTIGTVLIYSLPILLVIPTAVETRFFVGVHIVIYLFAAMVLMNVNWWQNIWKCKWKKIGRFLLFLGLCFLLNSQTFNCYGIPLW